MQTELKALAFKLDFSLLACFFRQTGTLSDFLMFIIFQILSITNKLQTLFLGLGNNEVSLIKQTELKALTFKLGFILANSSLIPVSDTEHHQQAADIISGPGK